MNKNFKIKALSIIFSSSSLMYAVEQQEEKKHQYTSGSELIDSSKKSEILEQKSFNAKSFNMLWGIYKKDQKTALDQIKDYLIFFHQFEEKDQTQLLDSTLNNDQEDLFNLVTSNKLNTIKDPRIWKLVDGQIIKYYEKNDLFLKLDQALHNKKNKTEFNIKFGSFPISGCINLKEKKEFRDNVFLLDNAENVKNYCLLNSPSIPQQLMASIVHWNHSIYASLLIPNWTSQEKAKQHEILFTAFHGHIFIQTLLQNLVDKNEIRLCNPNLLVDAWTILYSVNKILFFIPDDKKNNFTTEITQLYLKFQNPIIIPNYSGIAIESRHQLAEYVWGNESNIHSLINSFPDNKIFISYCMQYLILLNNYQFNQKIVHSKKNIFKAEEIQFFLTFFEITESIQIIEIISNYSKNKSKELFKTNQPIADYQAQKNFRLFSKLFDLAGTKIKLEKDDLSFVVHYQNLLAILTAQNSEVLFDLSITPSNLDTFFDKFSTHTTEQFQNEMKQKINQYKQEYNTLILNQTQKNASTEIINVQNSNDWQQLDNFLNYYGKNQKMFSQINKIETIINEIIHRKKNIETQFETQLMQERINSLNTKLHQIDLETIYQKSILNNLNHFLNDLKHTKQVNIDELDGCYAEWIPLMEPGLFQWNYSQQVSDQLEHKINSLTEIWVNQDTEIRKMRENIDKTIRSIEAEKKYDKKSYKMVGTEEITLSQNDTHNQQMSKVVIGEESLSVHTHYKKYIKGQITQDNESIEKEFFDIMNAVSNFLSHPYKKWEVNGSDIKTFKIKGEKIIRVGSRITHPMRYYFKFDDTSRTLNFYGYGHEKNGVIIPDANRIN